MRVSFLTPINTKEVPSPDTPPFLMPPYWAATLVSNLPNELKKEMDVRLPHEVCDFYFSSFKVCNDRTLKAIRHIRTTRKQQNSKCVIAVGGWGPTLHPKEFSRCADIIVTGTFNEAIETFRILLGNWVDGEIKNLENIKGIFTRRTGFTGFRPPTLGKAVDWEEFCKLTRTRMSDYEDKHIGMFFLPLKISPLSCPNYVKPFVSNIKKGTKFEVGCNLCAVAYAAEKLAVELTSLHRRDIIDDLRLSEDNFDRFLSRAREEVVSALSQLCKEHYFGRVDVYDCDDTLSPLKLELLSKLMYSKYGGKRIKDYLTVTLRTRPDVLSWAINELDKRGLMDRFGFEVEAHYASPNDIMFSNSNFSKGDLENFIASIKKYKGNFFMGLFILTSPQSNSKDFAENVDMVIRSIGAGSTSTGIGERTGIGNNRLAEEYPAPCVVNPEIRATVEEYLVCLDSWLKGEKFHYALSKHKGFKKTLEKIFPILGEMDQRKKTQVLTLKNALERLLTTIDEKASSLNQP